MIHPPSHHQATEVDRSHCSCKWPAAVEFYERHFHGLSPHVLWPVIYPTIGILSKSYVNREGSVSWYIPIYHHWCETNHFFLSLKYAYIINQPLPPWHRLTFDINERLFRPIDTPFQVPAAGIACSVLPPLSPAAPAENAPLLVAVGSCECETIWEESIVI